MPRGDWASALARTWLRSSGPKCARDMRLLEPVAGYTDAQIEMPGLAVRYYAGGPLALERLTLLDITSLRPFDRLTFPSLADTCRLAVGGACRLL